MGWEHSRGQPLAVHRLARAVALVFGAQLWAAPVIQAGRRPRMGHRACRDIPTRLAIYPGMQSDWAALRKCWLLARRRARESWIYRTTSPDKAARDRYS